MTEPFLLHLPTAPPLPILASIPHCGLQVPAAIAQTLTAPHQQFLPNQDWHLEQLYDFLPKLGITVLQATYSRYVVDLNRSLQSPLFGSFWRSAVPEKTAFDLPLYHTLPTPEAIAQRIQAYYQPYHQQLQTQIQRLIHQFGKVYLLDLHSFLGLITDDICLGNANGSSCSEFLITAAQDIFSAQGYQVVCNKVFSGGYITQHYKNPPQIEALQIEVRYPVYLDSADLDQRCVPRWQVPQFDAAKQTFEVMMQSLATRLAQADISS